MEQLLINGGRRLFGSVRIPGAKNSALPLMAACILCGGNVTLENVPFLSDVAAAAQILETLGCTVSRQDTALSVCTARLAQSKVPPHLMQTMRSSVFFLAPVLARTGHAYITQPGGCQIGARPIDIHLAGLAAMGAQIEEDGEEITLHAPNGLQGTDFALRLPSVGATETLLMAACAAHGVTTLRGVATEPEVVDLARFLTKAGADISGVGSRTLTVRGQGLLQGANYSVCPDRIVAATVLCAVAGCGGEVLLTDCEPAALEGFLSVFSETGCIVSRGSGTSLAVSCAQPLRGVKFSTGVFPAFPTDAAPLLAAALLLSQGESSITDTVFEHRFGCASGFAALGANAHVFGRTLTVQGVQALHGTALVAQDLRGGAALALAAMMAQGESSLTGVPYLARGYEDFAAMFSGLGAEVLHVGREVVTA